MGGRLRLYERSENTFLDSSGHGLRRGAVILIMSVTGVLLMYQRQIITWFDRDFRTISRQTGAVRLPVETIRRDLVSKRERAIGNHIASRAGRPGRGELRPRTRVFCRHLHGQRPRERVAENPVVLSNSGRLASMAGSERSTSAAARAVTGACNFAFLFLVISGPYLWIPRKWSWQSIRAVTAFRGGLSGRARDFNWHNVIGSGVPLPCS